MPLKYDRDNTIYLCIPMIMPLSSVQVFTGLSWQSSSFKFQCSVPVSGGWLWQAKVMFSNFNFLQRLFDGAD